MLQVKSGILSDLPIDEIYSVLKNASFFSVLFPLLLCLIKFKTLNTTLRVLLFYLCISGLSDLLSHIFSQHCIECCEPMANIFTLLQFSAFSYIYYLEFSQERIKWVVLNLTFAYLLFYEVTLSPMNGYVNGNSIVTVVEGFIMFILTLFFLYTVLIEMSIPRLVDDSFIWLSFGIIIYFAISLVLFFADDYLRSCSKRMFKLLWSLHLLANITFNILAAISVWKRKNLE